jgi:hypothetical protein
MGNAVTVLSGLFQNAESAAGAVHRLRLAGVVERDIEVVSGVPFPDETFKENPPKVFLQWIALAGGILGALVGLLVAGGTALLYSIPTGHMNIVAGPPVGIVTYEIMMLGAIVFTIVGLALALARRRARIEEPRIGEGYVAVAVPSDGREQVLRLREILLDSGAVEVNTPEGQL